MYVQRARTFVNAVQLSSAYLTYLPIPSLWWFLSTCSKHVQKVSTDSEGKRIACEVRDSERLRESDRESDGESARESDRDSKREKNRIRWRD